MDSTASPPGSYNARTTASESSTGIPSRANSFPVSVLPIPMEPVSPTRNGRLVLGSGNSERFQQMRAKSLCNGGTDTEPGGESRYRLVHQHSQAVHDRMPSGFGLPQQ